MGGGGEGEEEDSEPALTGHRIGFGGLHGDYGGKNFARELRHNGPVGRATPLMFPPSFLIF